MAKTFDMTPEHVFYVCDGTTIRNVGELGTRLKRMSVEAFSHHVNSAKNDFALWARDCIGDEVLAARLVCSNDQLEMCKIIGERIAQIKAQQGESNRVVRLSASVPVHKERVMKAVVASRLSTPSLEKVPEKTIVLDSSAVLDISDSIKRIKQSVVSSVYQPVSSVYSKPSVSSEKSEASLDASLLEKKVEHKVVKVDQKQVVQSSQQSMLVSRSVKHRSASGKSRSVYKEWKKPVLRLPLESYSFEVLDSHEKVSTRCDHVSHTQCMRCGLLEFFVGLVLGLVFAFFLAKTLVGF
ncbi:MAG: hypothetical protein AABX52_03980 [Nanoarchaeota archaeon]